MIKNAGLVLRSTTVHRTAMTDGRLSNGCPSHLLILLTQGPICEILVKIAQLLGVVEKLSFFESANLIFFSKFDFSFASFLLKLITN
jgi:hypothetical protein